MDITLVINPGSSSKKYAFFRDGNEVLNILFEKKNKGYGRCVSVNRTQKQCKEVKQVKYGHALAEVLSIAQKEEIISSPQDVTRVGVRIVAPGTFFSSHRVIDFAYIKKLRSIVNIAPLHIPGLLKELEQVEVLLEGVRILGISDSAFHSTLPVAAKWYALPKKLVQKYDLYRFGYHGLSVASVVRLISSENVRFPERTVVCHIGSGVSVTALKNRNSVDTTMGFGPTSGLMMGTRGGGVDPSALIQLMRDIPDPNELEELVSKKGGLKGVLGVGDLRIVIDRKQRGDKDAEIAFDMFIRAIRKAIGSMSAVLGGIDMLVLTGTAAARNPTVRKHIAESFEYLGLALDDQKNEELKDNPGIFSLDSSTVIARVVHTDEMAEAAHIARIL